MFYVLSLKWSRNKDHLVWWCPNDSGYTYQLERAGKYTAAQIAAHPASYDNGDETLAVPVEAADAMAVRVVHGDRWRELRAARDAWRGGKAGE
jgi:hypothetical protein